MDIPDPYQLVADEMKTRQLDEPLWIRSVAESGGDDAKARARYLQLRVEKVNGVLREKAAIEQRTTKEAAKAKANHDAQDRRWQAARNREIWWEENWLATFTVVGLLFVAVLLWIGYGR